MKSKVYFSKEISPEMVIDMYEALGIDLEGKVAVKVHSGEEGNTNFLRPEFWKPMVDKINGTIVIISHQERILKTADRIIVLGGGKVLREGTRDEIYDDLIGDIGGGVCGRLAGGEE